MGAGPLELHQARECPFPGLEQLKTNRRFLREPFELLIRFLRTQEYHQRSPVWAGAEDLENLEGSEGIVEWEVPLESDEVLPRELDHYAPHERTMSQDYLSLNDLVSISDRRWIRPRGMA
jgi:hypothetical protein